MGAMTLAKFRKVKTIDLPNWRSLSDMWGEPTIMFHELLRGEPLQIGDRVTIDLCVLVEKKE